MTFYTEQWTCPLTWASLMPIKPPKVSHLPCQMNSHSLASLAVWVLWSVNHCVFHQTPQKQYQIPAKTVSLPGCPFSPFLGATPRNFWEKKHELVKRRLVIAFLVELLLNYHQRKSGNRGKFWSVIDMSARFASQRDLGMQRLKFPACLSSFRAVPQWTSPMAVGDRWLMLPQEEQTPAARHFSGCLQTGSAPLRLSRRVCSLTCLPDPNHGQTWVGQCLLKTAGGYQAKFSFPGCHEVHLTLVSKSLDTQPVWFCSKAQHWCPKYNVDAPMLTKEFPNSNLHLQDNKNILLYSHDHSHVTKALFTKPPDVLL